MKHVSPFLLPMVLVTWPALAQLDPEDAQVISYFPQVADGGLPSQKWVTSFTFLNPHPSIKANVTLDIYGNDGSPLALDFGAGPTSETSFSLTAQGTITFVSRGASSNIATGWAVVTSSLPLQGVVRYQYSVHGVPQQGVSVEATPASLDFLAPATINSGIALVNPNDSADVTIYVLDTNGVTVASSSVMLASGAHQAFNLNQVFPSLPPGFRGSVQISSGTQNYFVALILSGDGGVLSSLPPAGLAWPPSQYERIWKIWMKVLNAALNNSRAAPSLSKDPGLVIDPSTQALNSFACVSVFNWCPVPDDTVHIFYNIAELMSDSDGELAFIAAHELGHVIQSHSATLPYAQFDLKFVPSNAEWDADIWGLILSLEAGYDPWSGTGALGRLMTASTGVATGLLAANFDGINDPHGSLFQRLGNIWNSLVTACSQTQACAQYKAIFHPHFPGSAPLLRRPVAAQAKEDGR